MKLTKLTGMAAILLSCVLILNSCKKGANDPAISFKSRTSRVAGTWTVAKQSGTQLYHDNTGVNDDETMTQSWNGVGTNMYVQTDKYGTTSFEDKGDVTANTITFGKDGSYTMTRKYTIKEVRTDYPTTGSTTTTDYVIEETETGTWNFTGGVGSDLKSKEQIVINSSASTYKETKTETLVTTFGTTTITDITVTTTDNTDTDNTSTSLLTLTELRSKSLKGTMSLNQSHKSTSKVVNHKGTSGETSNTNTSDYKITGDYTLELTQ